MSSKNCPEYCDAVIKFIANEEQNADYWLRFEAEIVAEGKATGLDTKTTLMKIVIEEMVTKMAEECAGKETGVARMFEQRNRDEL